MIVIPAQAGIHAKHQLDAKSIMLNSESLSIRPLEKSDLPLLHQWQNQPHLYPYYQPKPITLEGIIEHYMPRITGQHKTYCHIASLNGKPFGYLQCYKNMDHADYTAGLGLTDGAGIDLYIGDTAFLGRGYGRKMLRQYIEEIVFTVFPEETKCYIWHNFHNIVALRCSKAVGFRFVREAVEKGALGELLLYERTGMTES